MAKEWYVVQFKSNAYRQAIKNLNRQKFETFLPLQDITQRSMSSFKNKSRPLFPSYMFVSFDQSNSNWNKINNTYGVSRIISFNKNLKAVPISLMNELIQRCDSAGKLLPHDKFRKGDKVKVLSGPFAKFFAVVDTLEPDNRIRVFMELMGRETKIEVSYNELQLSN
jgi:transcriptional antiterminator RfaH